MKFYSIGILIGLISFLSIGLFHPIVIKAEYYFSCKCWPCFLALGILLLLVSTQVSHTVASCALAVLGFSSLWSILEIFQQKNESSAGGFLRTQSGRTTTDSRNAGALCPNVT